MYCVAFLFLFFFTVYMREQASAASGRSARFATSSELLYLLNLLYNMPSECYDEYKLIQLIPEEFRVVFRFLTYITFELIPQSRDRPVGSLGDTSTIMSA